MELINFLCEYKVGYFALGVFCLVSGSILCFQELKKSMQKTIQKEI